MKPHICLVNSLRTWGGAEVWFLETALALRDRGIAASLVCQPGSQLLRRARQAGAPAAAIPIRFDAAPWTLARLFRHFRATGTTAVVANLTKDLKAAAVAGRLAGVARILASRESDFPLKDKLHYRWYFNHLATGVLVGSQATRRTVLASCPWLAPERVHLLHKGIDLTRFHPAAASPAGPAQGAVVGFVGQLIARKGLTQLMDAWTGIDRRAWPGPPPVLRIAGEGVLEADLRAWRDTLQRPGAVELAGFVEDIPAFYRKLDLLVMPSVAEGFGLAAAEAGASGVPVIATAVSSLPEIVVHRETGLLVPPDDVAALTAALDDLLKKPDLARQMGRAARARVAARFDGEKTLDRLLALCGCAGGNSPERDRP